MAPDTKRIALLATYRVLGSPARRDASPSANLCGDVGPDYRPQPLSRLGLDCESLIHLLGNWLSGIRMYVTRECLEEVCMHVGSSSNEVGGLLLGRAFEVQIKADPLVLIERSLESLEFRNSAIMLEMNTEVWDRAHAAFEEGRCVVGWYHSHQNLGAFFSATDRSTQRAFFDQLYSIGWVLDPNRVEQKVFVAQDSIEYPVLLISLDHELEKTGPLSELQDAYTMTVEVKMVPTVTDVTVVELNSARGKSG